MKRFISFLITFCFLFLTRSHPVLAETIELTPVADSFVNDVYPEQNQGSAHSLVVSHDSAFRWSLVRFDLASVPTNSIIDSTIFKLYLYDSSGDASVPLMIARITGDWSESEVKWNNRPMFDESTGVSVNIDTATGYKSWEITNFVKGWLKGDFSNFGVAVGYSAGNFARSFRSQEYASNEPILTINYHLPEPSPTPSPTPTLIPTPTPTATPQSYKSPTPAPTEEALPTETPSPTPSPSPEAEEEKAPSKTGLWLGAGILGGGLLGALLVFGLTKKKKPKKAPQTPEKPKEE